MIRLLNAELTESVVDLSDVQARLIGLNVDAELIEQACATVVGSAIGVMIYGSWARGDADAASDVDLLILTDTHTRRANDDKISLSVYSPDQLAEAGTTLFGMHLARDGIILHDTDDRMARLLDSFTAPDPDKLLTKVRRFATIINLPRAQQLTYISGLCQVGRYLLRTAIYANALRDGEPCFSLKELADRHGQPELSRLLSSHPGVYPEPNLDVLDDLRARLAAAVGASSQSEFGSIQALIVGSADVDPELATLATLALGVDKSLSYSELPKVVL